MGEVVSSQKTNYGRPYKNSMLTDRTCVDVSTLESATRVRPTGDFPNNPDALERKQLNDQFG